MQKITTELYKKYFVSNTDVHLIPNQDSLKIYRNIERIGKVFIVYLHEGQTENSFFITEKGLISYFKGSSFNLSWSEFKNFSIGYSGNRIFLGGLLLHVNQAKEFALFFKEVQKILNTTSISSDEEALKILKKSQERMALIEQKLDFYISVVSELNHLKNNII